MNVHCVYWQSEFIIVTNGTEATAMGGIVEFILQ
jgi:hypothetical protein